VLLQPTPESVFNIHVPDAVGLRVLHIKMKNADVVGMPIFNRGSQPDEQIYDAAPGKQRTISPNRVGVQESIAENKENRVDSKDEEFA